MDRPFHMLTPYDDLVQFVRFCGFLLVSEAFLFRSLVLFYLLFGNAIKMDFFACRLTFSFPLMVVIFLGKFFILLKAIVL